MKKVIYVPQGCYAKFTLLSIENQNVIGFITSGLGPCCHVIVANRATGFMVLCHADDLINLEDSNNGILAWIKEACSVGDYENLITDMGEDQDNPRSGNMGIYLEQLNNVIDQLNNEQPGININLTYHGVNFIEYGISIFRNPNDVLVISERNHQPNVIIDEETEADREIMILKDERGILEDKIVRARIYAHDRDKKILGQDTKFPPICIYDGTNDELLSLEAISRICDEYGIDWDYITNSALPSSYSVSERYSTDFDSETTILSSGSAIEEDTSLQLNQYTFPFSSFLASQDLHIIEAGGDGDCFFHAIARQLEQINYNKIMTHEELRQFAINYMTLHPHEFQEFTEISIDDYIYNMSQTGAWADNP